MITLKELKDKLEKDFGWENLDCEDNKWLVDRLLKDAIEAITVTHCCKSDSEELVCDDNELDCPYEFTSRCTMGRCDCKPKAK
jgi:hypothetical protein